MRDKKSELQAIVLIDHIASELRENNNDEVILDQILEYFVKFLDSELINDVFSTINNNNN